MGDITMSSPHIIGERIRHYRKLHNVTQMELAKKLDVAPRYIGNIEQGNRRPSLDMMVEICNWFGVELSDILPLGTKKETCPKDQLIYEIAATCQTLDISQIKIVKTMICSLKG